MNRNTNLLMGAIPQIHAQRSKINRSKSLHTGFNVGDVIPIYTDLDILPGDTVEMDITTLTRLATPIVPVMDNLSMDIYAFFVPHRLVYEHWAEFWGENEDAWTQQIEYVTPMIEAPSGGWAEGSIADYMGIPTKVGNFSVNAFGFRAYAKIWNDWFRDENLKDAAHIYVDDTTRTGVNTGTYVTDLELGGLPAKAAKTADLYTKCLPAPQKGPSVAVPIGTKAKIHTGEAHTIASYQPMTVRRVTEGENGWINGGKWEPSLSPYNLSIDPGTATADYTGIMWASEYDTTPPETENPVGIVPNNLWADLSNATAATINELRTAFAIQKYYEAAARYGWARA